MIVALLNQKGGVGKTTLALHLAGEWALHGRRVTLVDADPQGSALDWSQQRARENVSRLFGVVGNRGNPGEFSYRSRGPVHFWPELLRAMGAQVNRPSGGTAAAFLGVEKRRLRRRLLLAPPLDRRRDAHRLTVFRHGPPGDVDARVAKNLDDRVVRENGVRRLAINEAADAVTHRFRRMRFAALG